jgi:protein gp37
MAQNTKIEWTNVTWNPTTGCTKVSAGCKNCYAEVMSKRLAAMGKEKYQGILTDSSRFNGTVRTHEDALRIPFTWRKPRKVFVNSMSDLFHEDVPFAFIDKVFAVMALTPHHTYQILTKRPDRMAEYMTTPNREGEIKGCAWNMLGYMPKKNNAGMKAKWPLPNVWLGTSVEYQQTANERIPHLLDCPAAVRFLSCEPLLGAVDLTAISHDDFIQTNALGNEHNGVFKRVNWVIAGGESGPKARPMHPEWARGLRDQCKVAGVAFFFKQWGEWLATPYGGQGSAEFNWCERGETFQWMCKVGKHKSGRLLDGVEHNAFPTPAQSQIANRKPTIANP